MLDLNRPSRSKDITNIDLGQDYPLPPGTQQMTKQWNAESDEDKRETEKKYNGLDYRSCVRSLIYLETGTRYDIMFAVTKLAKFVSNPGIKHYEMLIWLLGYLKKFPNLGIRYYAN